jgi:hypothetical protein
MSGRRSKWIRTPVNADFPLRGLMRCGICGGPVTACMSRGHGGRYGYYFCRSGHVRLRAERVHESWTDLLVRNAAEFVPVLAKLRAELRVVFTERLDAVGTVSKAAFAARERIRAQRTRLLDAYLAGSLTQELFASKDAELATKEQRAQADQEATMGWMTSVDDCVRRAVALFEDPVALWARLPLADRRRFAGALYSGELALTAAGVVEPASGAGLAGTIRELTAPETTLARLPALLSNLERDLRPLLDLAA